MINRSLLYSAVLVMIAGMFIWTGGAAYAAAYAVAHAEAYLSASALQPGLAQNGARWLQVTDTITATVATQPPATATASQAPPSATMPAATDTASHTVPPADTQPAATTQAPAGPSATPEPFTLTRVEPDRIVQETGGSLSIYGSGFGPGTAVRLVGYGLLDSALINSRAIRAIVPPGLPEGRYSVEVILSSGATLRESNAIRIRSDQEKPTPTNTPGPPLVYGKPEIMIQRAGTNPEQVNPGGFFTLILSVINRGDYTATNVQVAVNAEGLAVPRGATNLVIFDTMESNESQTVEFPLALSDTASNGYHSLGVDLSYKDYYGRAYSAQQSVGVSVSSVSDTQPLVLLTAYATEPETLSPGDAFTLRLEVSNVGQTTASQVLVTLGGQDGSGTRPFALLDAGNVKFIPSLAAGETLELEQRIILDGGADSGVYNLPVMLAYEAADGTPESESQILNLLVSRHPQLRIDYFEQPGFSLVGEPVELLIEVVNIGRNLVNVSTIEINSPDLEIIQGTTFIGALDGGTSGSLSAQVIPQRGGELPVNVTVNYLDDFNQPQQITHALSLSAEEPAMPEPGGAATDEEPSQEGGFWSGVWRFIRALFGLGA